MKKNLMTKRLAFGLGVLMALALIASSAAAQAAKPKAIDVNTADLKTLQTLPGIGEALAQKIIDGRPYKTLADLENVKGLGQTKIDGLKGLVSFSKVKAVKDTSEKAVVEKTKDKTETTAVEKELVNVNKADLKTLTTLPGIGEALAQKIIDGRPFKTLEDLGKVKGLGEAKLKGLTGLVAFEDKVKEKAVKEKTATDKVKTEVEKPKTAAETKVEGQPINVNKADLKTLATLPGIGEALAQKIIDGRPFKTIEDLGKVKGIGEAKLKGLTGLVAFEDKAKEKAIKEKTATTDKVKTATETSGAKTKLAPGEKLDINSATAEQLDGLFGIGPVKSQAIVEYRQANGKFKAIEDIMKVKGIKEGEFAKIKDLIKVK
jgi:competence protein ComEA